LRSFGAPLYTSRVQRGLLAPDLRVCSAGWSPRGSRESGRGRPGWVDEIGADFARGDAPENFVSLGANVLTVYGNDPGATEKSLKADCTYRRSDCEAARDEYELGCVSRKQDHHHSRGHQHSPALKWKEAAGAPPSRRSEEAAVVWHTGCRGSVNVCALFLESSEPDEGHTFYRNSPHRREAPACDPIRSRKARDSSRIVPTPPPGPKEKRA